MSVEEEALREFSHTVVDEARAGREARAQTIADARVQRRRGRRLRDQALAVRERNLDLGWQLWTLDALPEPPSMIPLAWDALPDKETALEGAAEAAEECARACTAGLAHVDGKARLALRSIAAVSSLASDHVREREVDPAPALGLCVRLIDSRAEGLDRAARSGSGLVAASAARRCSRTCHRTLASLYPVGGSG